MRTVIAVQCKGASPFDSEKNSMETGSTTLSEFSNGGKAIVEQILASEEINKSKRAGLEESESVICVEKFCNLSQVI